MSKLIAENHITAEKGVSTFQLYCANHNPILLFREETKHDYGIDGEVEITNKTNTGKIEATGHILKIQLKSTKHRGYISNDTDSSFDFIAKSQDIEYWNQHVIPVVLVIYFENENRLYAKKIDKEFVLRNRSTHKITFDKTLNNLSPTSDFETIVEQNFISRVDFNITENLFINLFKISLPSYLNLFKSNYSNAKDIYEYFTEKNVEYYPKFVISSKIFHTFEDIGRYSSVLKNEIVESTADQIPIKKYIDKGTPEKNLIVRLVKVYLKEYLYQKGIKYNKDLDRFYFANFNSKPLKTNKKANSTTEVFRIEKYRGKSNRNDTRSVVSKYTYYEKSTFYRHLAFQVSFEWIENELYLLIDPKYLYTEDGKIPLSNKERVTRLTNQLKQSERNSQYINHLFFLRNFLDSGNICLFFESEKSKVEIRQIERRLVNFGIKEDTTTGTSKPEESGQILLDL